MASLRVAIFHDFLEVPGGGERTVLSLAQGLAAPIYTTNHDPRVEEFLGYRGVEIHSLGSLPRRYPWKQVRASLLFARARVPGFDAYVLSGNWGHYASRHHRPNLFYCHTPPRFFYDLEDRFLGYLPAWQRPPARLWIGLHRRWDRRTLGEVDAIVANSENVRRRIRRFYGREARVIHPPVPLGRYRFEGVGDFWLSVNRLYPEKRLDLQMEIFRRLPSERLLVVGGFPRGDHAEAYARALKPPPNVELKGEVDEATLGDLYARCKGLIATAVDEDFGITPVEAMASGKVTLAVDEGGYRETVMPRVTGWLLPPHAQAFVDLMRKLDAEKLLALREACQEAARQYDEVRFLHAMEAILAELPRKPK